MILERFYDDKLAQASYLIGCPSTGEALVVDANRDVDRYLEAAGSSGLRVTHVTETHIHADYVSGSRELAVRAGAALYLSDEGGEDWKYAFAGSDGAILLKDGAFFRVGNVLVEAVHTPGHTPEHLSFLVTDTAAADRPIAMLTGDFVFVGDVGRPDLLEKAAKQAGTMEGAARTLFRSLEGFKRYPDYLQVLPGHGAGSACGKGISSVPTSTVGYERMFNWALSYEDEDAFVQAVLTGQPEAPTYFARMKEINREGPRVLGALERPRRLQETRLQELLDAGALVVDTRHAAEYAQRHVPGSINIPLNRTFSTWAGWLVPYDVDFYLIVNDSCTHCVDEAIEDLSMIGLDRVGGYFGTRVIDAWAASGLEIASIPQTTPQEVAARLRTGAVEVLDVRGKSEWETGHLPGARNVPVGHVADHLDEIPRDRPVVVHCESGARAAIAASVLRSRGFDNVTNLAGGFADWKAGGNPIVREAPEPVGSHAGDGDEAAARAGRRP